MIKEVRDLSKAEVLPGVNACLGERLRTMLAETGGARIDVRLDRTLEYIAKFVLSLPETYRSHARVMSIR
jgi:hypothetical protein